MPDFCSITLILPNSRTLVLRQEERIGFLYVEGSIPFVDVWQCAVHACLVGRVDIHLQQHVSILRTIVACPDACPSEEEALAAGPIFYVYLIRRYTPRLSFL